MILNLIIILLLLLLLLISSSSPPHYPPPPPPPPHYPPHYPPHHHHPDIPLQGNQDVSVLILLCFLVWDYLPTLLLVVTITSKALGGTNRRSVHDSHEASWITVLNRQQPS